MTKNDIRKMMKVREREFLSADGAAVRVSDEIIAAIESGMEFRTARTLLCYMELPGEVMMRKAVERWSAGGKRIVLPLVCGQTLALKEYNPSQLREGYMGILEPCPEAVELAPGEIDLAIVPGIAFTSDGYRLGRGKGFYDRLLPRLNCPKMGVCFPFRILPELPLDSWDAPLDYVITAENTI